MPPDLNTILSLIGSGGTVGVLILGVWLFISGKVVPASLLREIRHDRDDWKEMALTGANAAEKALALAQRRRQDRNRRAE